jgi:hypothetical protein
MLVFEFYYIGISYVILSQFLKDLTNGWLKYSQTYFNIKKLR